MTACDEKFGFGARDEDGGGDAEGEAVKLGLAEDVLDGLEAKTAFDEALVGGLLVAIERAFGVRDEGGALYAEGVHEEECRVGQRSRAAGRGVRRAGWWRGLGLAGR